MSHNPTPAEVFATFAQAARPVSRARARAVSEMLCEKGLYEALRWAFDKGSKQLARDVRTYSLAIEEAADPAQALRTARYALSMHERLPDRHPHKHEIIASDTARIASLEAIVNPQREAA